MSISCFVGQSDRLVKPQVTWQAQADLAVMNYQEEQTVATLLGKVALVTGGARGIGAGIAKSLARAGAQVAIADLGLKGNDGNWTYHLSSESQANETLKALQDIGGQHASFALDVTQMESCEQVVQQVLSKFGRIDILCNNAGVVDSGAIDQFSEKAWDRIFAVNCKGLFLMSKAATAALRSNRGCIINTASIAGKKGYPNMSAYCASKFAAIGFTQSLAAELAPAGVRVNAICPGMVGTAMWLDHLLPKRGGVNEASQESFEAAMAQTIPLGRAQTVEDMGQAVVYLASAENVTGVALSVAGGFEMN